MLFVSAAWRRPDVVIGLVVLGAAFGLIERRWPITPQPFLRAGWQTDVVHFLVDQVGGGLLLGLAVLVLVPVFEPLLPNLDTLLPANGRFMAALVVGELTGYWGHRLMHRVPALWKLHAVHHSSPTMDWLAPNRRHLLDTALGQAFSVVPLLALGLKRPEVATWFVLSRAQGLFVHANIRCHLPIVRWFVATPEFHHWHHSSDPSVYNRNFAGQTPIVDWLFGTLYLPTRSWPAAYGLDAGAGILPAGYLQQLWWPFADIDRQASSRKLVAIALAFSGAVGVVAVADAAEPPLTADRLICDVPTLGMIDIGPDGIIVTSPGEMPDRTSVRASDGHRGFRIVRRSGAPLTLTIAGNALSAAGPEGVAHGPCMPA